jgi:leader peptidase (prepilin peptidase) / N-methyltransferase
VGLIGAFVGAGWLTALSIYDLRSRRLPNWLTLPGAIVILGVAALSGRGVPAAVGAATLFATYLAVHLVSPAGMGAGDVKLAVGVGALTGSFGADVWVLAALGAPVLTASTGLLTGRRAVPHGPSMCVASAAAVALALA